MVAVARRTLGFYREESCGKCTPCREGTGWLEEILIRMEDGGGREKDIDLLAAHHQVHRRQELLPLRRGGGVGPAEQPGQVPAASSSSYIEQTNPEDVGPMIPIRPIYRPDRASPACCATARCQSRASRR